MSLVSVRIDPRFERPALRAAANAEVMVADGRHRTIDVDPPRRVVEEALARIVDSRTFRHSERHRAFLRYVVEAALDGRARFLKEVVIGIEIFRRDLDRYDPRRDSIVRVEARRLRKKLARYYLVEGDREAIEIRLDAGSYVPRFVPRAAARRADAASPRLLVMPCRTNAAAADAAVARGLADQLIDRLGGIAGLNVLAPLAAARLCGVDVAVDLEALRRAHRVRYVVDGSLARVGDRLRCVLHLSRTDDGVQRWSATFDFDPAAPEPAADRDLFAFQDRIVHAVFDAVGAEVDERA